MLKLEAEEKNDSAVGVNQRCLRCEFSTATAVVDFFNGIHLKKINKKNSVRSPVHTSIHRKKKNLIKYPQPFFGLSICREFTSEDNTIH